MVWPPPKIQATPEGEAPREAQGAPRRDVPEVTGAYGASAGALPSALPPDWLQHPEKLVGAVLGGRYRVTGLLGRGPMGFAVEAESSRGRQVTLKLLPRPPELTVERFAWLVREALALAHFDHENVVASTDFGALEGGGAFVSRSRVPGVPLRALLRQGALPLRRALDLGRQIALGLAAGHAQEISHGRLKPENVLVQAGTQSSDLVKLVDFGMAQLPVAVRSVVGDENEARRLALRTRIYLPGAHLPGVEALPPSPAVDVYSLGVLLFEMIAGQPPFVFDSGGWPNLHGGPIGFAQCNSPAQVSPVVDEIVGALLRPNAGVSAQQVAGVLESLLGRPSVAPALAPAEPEPEPVTSQLPGFNYTERHPSSEPPAATALGVAPELRAPSFPPLPAGYPLSHPPSLAPGEPPRYSPQPPVAGPSGSYPPLTLDRSLIDSLNPPAQRALDAAAFAPSSAPDSELDDAEAEFRPSLLARLRRMFGRSKPGGDF
ncbi:MAG: protein kinase [Deltaproteobacteria bacterium]